MAGTQLIAGYRLNAANCFDMAKEFADPERKLAMLEMATAWLRLAEVTEAFSDKLPVSEHKSKQAP